MCEMSNPLALSIHYFDDKKDAKAAIDALIDRTPGHGKITALMIRGAYMYDCDEEAYQTLYKPGYSYVIDSDDFVVYDALEDPNFDFRSHNMHPANWIKSLNDWRGPLTTWECMTYPPLKESNGGAWGDRSHPDTAIAHILSSYILGVMPYEAGFKSFTVAPHTAHVENAKGIIPTKYGDIYASWTLSKGVMSVNVDFEGNNELEYIRLKKSDADKFIVTMNGVNLEAKYEEDGYLFF